MTDAKGAVLATSSKDSRRGLKQRSANATVSRQTHRYVAGVGWVLKGRISG